MLLGFDEEVTFGTISVGILLTIKGACGTEISCLNATSSSKLHRTKYLVPFDKSDVFLLVSVRSLTDGRKSAFSPLLKRLTGGRLSFETLELVSNEYESWWATAATQCQKGAKGG